MKHFVTFLAGLLITAPIIGATLEGRTITLEDAEARACATEGSCLLITGATLERLLKADDCRSKI
jgi:hypothetical protein